MSRDRARFTPPVLCVPPLGVRPFIFDLYPEQSVIGLLLEEGFSVYLVDFGVPDATDQDLTLDDYVVRFLPAACEAVRVARCEPGAPYAGVHREARMQVRVAEQRPGGVPALGVG